ncbi:macrophage mannose receptor 1-like [Plakobranchus ocellatus]|uniref:Macrophage mannose receptor 1-like n=1 Tax=Plakobranchus ocellatus TaxID=259542 RepID=A0AAV3ZUD8_9GAST|nr:macrophage mannose receptor 1-like [Plakobranchus ocellatus]
MATFGQCCFLIVWTTFFTTFFANTQASIPCEPEWVKTPSGETCVHVHQTPHKSWHDARLACQSFGGDLVTVRDSTKNNFVGGLIPHNLWMGYWIGLHYKPAEDRWHWLDEEKTLTYNDWGRKPKRTSTKQCAFKYRVNELWVNWYTSECDGKQSYICEKPLAFPCYSGWMKSPSGEVCVKRFGDRLYKRLSWRHARGMCLGLGGDLMTIRDESISNFIKDRVVAGDGFPSWIGFNELIFGDRWLWLGTNATPTHTEWIDGYPVRTNENCEGVMKVKGQAAPWKTYQCSFRLGYICETPPPPHCYYEGTTYRHGAQISLELACGNPHTCSYSRWIPNTYQCLWKQMCLNLNETREGRTCSKDLDDGTRMILQKQVDAPS